MPNHAFAEPRAVSHGIGKRSRKRNTPSLLNVSVFRSTFDWDGRAKSLNAQLRGVFARDGDMGIDLVEAIERTRVSRSYNAPFCVAYGTPPDLASFVDAIVRFERSLVVGNSRVERFYLGGDHAALTATEKRGWVLFRGKAGCAGCHIPLPDPTGANVLVLRDNHFHNLGVGYNAGRMSDAGRYGVTRRWSDWGAFATPSLRNVALTAPYMHDGSVSSLEKVVDFYNEGGNKNPNLDAGISALSLSATEKADLVAFMRALTTDWLADSNVVRTRLLGLRVSDGVK